MLGYVQGISYQSILYMLCVCFVCFSAVCWLCTGYELIGFISHLGTSIDDGRYIAHILKRGRWVVFDDDKVGEYCEGGIPDKGKGYIFLRENRKTNFLRHIFCR